MSLQMVTFILACLALVFAIASHFWIKKLGLRSKDHANQAREAAKRTEAAAQRISDALNRPSHDKRP